MVVGQSGALRSDLVQISGWWSGVTAALPVRWKKPKGEKRLRPNHAGVSAERQTLRPRTTTAMRTTAPRRAREPDPPDRTRGTRYERARAGVPFAAARPEEAGTSGSLAG